MPNAKLDFVKRTEIRTLAISKNRSCNEYDLEKKIL